MKTSRNAERAVISKYQSLWRPSAGAIYNWFQVIHLLRLFYKKT
jgi:hypothetical protein